MLVDDKFKQINEKIDEKFGTLDRKLGSLDAMQKLAEK
jgi:hypothetical protein